MFNLGTDEYREVNDSISWITEALGPSRNPVYAGGDRGWIGDNPFRTYLKANRWVLGWRA